MSWAKLDDRFWSHRKVRRAGLEAVGLFAIALSWSSDNGTGGVIPYDDCMALSRRTTLWTRLREVGLLDDFTPEKGATIHHFGDYNDTPEVAAAKKAARVEKAKKANAVRWSLGTGDPPHKDPPSTGIEDPPTIPRVRDPVPSRPVPSEDPEITSAAPPSLFDLGPETAKAPKRKATKAKPEAPPPSDYRELVDHYFATFERVRGVRPAVFASREGKSIKAILAAVDLAEAKRRIDVAFRDPFYGSKGTINDIASKLDAFVGQAPARPTPPTDGPPEPTPEENLARERAYSERILNAPEGEGIKW